MSSESVQLVSQCESLQNLTYLDISFAMNEDGMKVLLNSSVLKNLKSLKMVGWAFDTSSRTSLSFVTESEIVKNLECLNLSGNQIDEYRIQAMFQNSNEDSSKLTRLDLSYNNIAFNGIQYLTSSKYIPYLKALTISYNPYIRDSSIVLLTQRDSMKHLTYLDLEGTSIGNESMKALSDISSTITNLTHLKIGKTHVKDEGLKFVTQCSHMSKLTTLSCVRSCIGDEGVYEIASSVFMSNLKHLNLSRCNVTLVGATALMESKLLRPNLRSLNLWQNKLSEEEKEMINTLNEENGWKVVL
ncbi:hypothetical protein C9374_011938 [Naegleria lovaniensis]|uniref:Uncharacterized protein n=1 Tax=Naegleria lovaniensis TaxID=51637 RepID=A0AA88GFI4_NAELO|nr:uncharacterized protein C9374_011938 [Naegleria lovaniensis]KAG2373649.1 hypothetical protein C9374_011938 [Naegleria lovaniensis]